MSSLFESISWVLGAFLVVIASSLVSLSLLWLVRKTIPSSELKKHHDVAGFTFSIIGILYSVILGFTVISVQNRYTDVLKTVHVEGMVLADLYQDAAFFAPNERDAIRDTLRHYVDYVIKEEWGLASETNIHLKTRKFLQEIWLSYYNINLKDDKTKIWYTESISKLDNFMDARLSRQFNSGEHLGSLMWTLLFVGAIITVAFMFFFGLDNVRIHMLMTLILAGYLSFMLYLVYSLDHAFKGPKSVTPYALEQVSILFNEWDKNTAP